MQNDTFSQHVFHTTSTDSLSLSLHIIYYKISLANLGIVRFFVEFEC